ncbi:MAG TPA: hypothetical protein QF753_11855 [Victivallales bacterium]|nr:hypothetical protein [Victivallales bacterium]
MRTLIYTAALIISFQCLIHSAQPIPVTTQVLKKISPSTSYFNGEVTPVETGKFGTLVTGKIVYIASPGDKVVSQVLDEKGKIVRLGTPIIILDKTIPKMKVETARINLQKARREMQNKENIYKRNYKLNSKKNMLIAQSKVELAKSEYDTALLLIKKSEIDLKEAEENLRRCTVFPSYTGQVDEVYFESGYGLEKFKDAIKITMMNPMSVELKLPLALVNKIGIENSIQVYDAGNKEPVRAILSKNPIDPSNVSLIVTNKLIPSWELTPQQKKYPIVHKALFIVKAYLPETNHTANKNKTPPPLAVPIKSIKKDGKGVFVWKAIDQNMTQTNKPVMKKFRIEKVYIKPGDIVRNISFIKGYGNHFRSIEKNGKISYGDIVLADPQDGLKDGEEVIYQQLHWRFTVGEKVKITISGLNAPGFYVPYTAIFNKYIGTPQVCIVEDGKAMFVNVRQTGLHGEYIRIEGEQLKEGEQIVLDANNALQNVYDGAILDITKTIEPLAKLSHNVAKAYAPVTGTKNTYLND